MLVDEKLLNNDSELPVLDKSGKYPIVIQCFSCLKWTCIFLMPTESIFSDHPFFHCTWCNSVSVNWHTVENLRTWVIKEKNKIQDVKKATL